MFPSSTIFLTSRSPFKFNASCKKELRSLNTFNDRNDDKRKSREKRENRICFPVNIFMCCFCAKKERVESHFLMYDNGNKFSPFRNYNCTFVNNVFFPPSLVASRTTTSRKLKSSFTFCCILFVCCFRYFPSFTSFTYRMVN